MAKSGKHPKPPPTGRTNLASCIVATIFLIFIVIIILIIYFTILKPKDPKLTVNAIQLPSFSISNGTVNFIFSQYATVKNSNKGVFSHYDSSLQLLYAGKQIGFMFIPAGKILSGKTEYMAATFSVKSFPLRGTITLDGGPSVTDGIDGVGVGVGFGPGLEIESRLELAGRVRILHFFSHHVDARAYCRVGISVSDGSVLGFQC